MDNLPSLVKACALYLTFLTALTALAIIQVTSRMNAAIQTCETAQAEGRLIYPLDRCIRAEFISPEEALEH